MTRAGPRGLDPPRKSHVPQKEYVNRERNNSYEQYQLNVADASGILIHWLVLSTKKLLDVGVRARREVRKETNQDCFKISRGVPLYRGVHHEPHGC